MNTAAPAKSNPTKNVLLKGQGDNEGGNILRLDALLGEDRRSALIKGLLACKTEEECDMFLTDLCTPQELDAMAERFLLARLLNRGTFSYRDISAATGASTTTVGRVARFLQQEANKGYQLVLKRLERARNE